MALITVPAHVAAVTAALRGAGHQAFVVGGAVRDALLGRVAQDWDVATDARPEAVLALFPHTVPTGLRFGTVTVLTGGAPVEVTTFRSDGTYGDGRRPDGVSFGDVIEDDLARRDFTINAMAYDAATDRLVDPSGGAADLQARLIRAVGEPRRRFGEDGLRLMRAVRFAAQLGFSLERETLAAVTHERAMLRKVAAERIRVELSKLLLSERPDLGLRLLRHSRLLEEVLPELVPAVGFAQHCTFHRWDVWEHTVRTVAAAPPELALRLAALLHDVAKPLTFSRDDAGNGHFYGHEKVGAELARQVLNRLRFDNETVAAVAALVRDHMWAAGPRSTAKAMRRLIHRLGPDRVPQLIALRLADKAGSGTPYNTADVDRLQRAIAEAAEQGQALTLHSLAINGRDLLDLGMPPGPALGRILAALFERVLDDPRLNQRERLLAMAAELRSAEPGEGGVGRS